MFCCSRRHRYLCRRVGYKMNPETFLPKRAAEIVPSLRMYTEIQFHVDCYQSKWTYLCKDNACRIQPLRDDVIVCQPVVKGQVNVISTRWAENAILLHHRFFALFQSTVYRSKNQTRCWKTEQYHVIFSVTNIIQRHASVIDRHFNSSITQLQINHSTWIYLFLI